MCNQKQKFIHYRKSAEIIELATAFENGTLPPEQWTHEVYLTIAFWHLFFNPPIEAQALIRNGIRRYCFENNIASTDVRANHETLMLFWTQMISFYMKRFGAKLSFLELANGVIRHFKDQNLPFRFYSRECLSSAKARTKWLEPDLILQSVRKAQETSAATCN